ncbi:10848_t:CDS:2 [Entrophospora sp. SA101]|nr:10848_t:CDS:2 [Entrophospora sp. SA101]CAJ0838537.1 22545_t:CDS:2 [Entrophospora sp. SA101]
MNYREKGNKAFIDGEFETARQEYTKGIEVAPEDPRLWSNRAQTFIKLGYPELAMVDAVNARSLIEPKITSGKYSDADLALFCKSGWREAGALAKCDGFVLAGRALDRIFQIVVNKRPVAGVDWNTWERERDNYYEKHYQHVVALSKVGSDRHAMVEQAGKMCKFPNRGAYPWDIRSRERCTSESLASIQKLLEKISGKSIKVSLVSFPNASQAHEFGIVATKDIKKGTILLEEKPLISVHAPGQQRCDFCNKQAGSKRFLCPKANCSEIFCNNDCFDNAWELYHRAICGKNLDLLYEIVKKESPFSGSSLLIVLKIFAIAKQRDICPLDIEEMKHLFPFQHSTAWFQHGPMAIDFYFELMKLLEIHTFDLRYEPWIYLTIYRKTKPNSSFFNPLTSTGQFYPIISLFNHHCDPNAGISDDVTKSIKGGKPFSLGVTLSTRAQATRNIKNGDQIFINYTLGHDLSILSKVGNTA